MSAASEGLQNRKNTRHQVFTLSKRRKKARNSFQRKKQGIPKEQGKEKEDQGCSLRCQARITLETGRIRFRIIEFFRGGAPEGATTLLHFAKCPRAWLQSVKSTLSFLELQPRRGHPVNHRLIGEYGLKHRAKTTFGPHRAPGERAP